MSFNFSPNIIKDKLVFYLDAANPRSYLSGTDFDDLIGKFGKGLTFINGPSFDPTNKAIYFDGVDDYAQADFTYSGKLTENMTFDIWFKRNSDMNSFNMIYGLHIPYLSFRGASAGIYANKFLFSFNTTLGATNTQRLLYSSNTYADNVWYNVTCTLSQDIINGTYDSKMYVNGELENSTVSSPASLDTLYQIPSIYNPRLGNYREGYTPLIPFNGWISTFKIYEKILSDDEIKKNYNALKNRYI